MAFPPLQLEGQGQIITQQNCSLLLFVIFLCLSWRWLSCDLELLQSSKNPLIINHKKIQPTINTHTQSFKGIAHYFVGHGLLPPVVKVKNKSSFFSPSVTLTKVNAGSLGNENSADLVQVMLVQTFSSVHTLAESPDWALAVLPNGNQPSHWGSAVSLKINHPIGNQLSHWASAIPLGISNSIGNQQFH